MKQMTGHNHKWCVASSHIPLQIKPYFYLMCLTVMPKIWLWAGLSYTLRKQCSAKVLWMVKDSYLPTQIPSDRKTICCNVLQRILKSSPRETKPLRGTRWKLVLKSDAWIYYVLFALDLFDPVFPYPLSLATVALAGVPWDENLLEESLIFNNEWVCLNFLSMQMENQCFLLEIIPLATLFLLCCEINFQETGQVKKMHVCNKIQYVVVIKTLKCAYD